MDKRIVSLFLVLCLLVSFFCVTSSAVYEIEEDTTVAPFMLMSSDVATASVEPSDLATYLQFSGSSVAKYLAYILYALTGSTSSMSNSVYTFLDSIDDQLLDQYSLLGFMSTYMSNISSNSNLLRISLDAIEDDVSIFESRLNSVISWLTSVNTSVTSLNSSLATVNSSVNTVDSSVNSVKTLLDTVSYASQNVLYLQTNGKTAYTPSRLTLTTILRIGLIGLQAQLNSPVDSAFLSSSGVSSVVSNETGNSLQLILRNGLLGLRSLIAGSEADNAYSVTVHDNNNSSTSASVTGLGPLLNTYFGALGENLGHLAFMFASDDDIKLKQDSQPLLDEADSFFDDSADSDVKVSADNIGSLKNYVGQASDLLDTGTDADDLFSVVSNQNSWLWFSVETAADLNTVPMTVSELDVDFYHSDFSENLYSEFYATYFPDR